MGKKLVGGILSPTIRPELPDFLSMEILDQCLVLFEARQSFRFPLQEKTVLITSPIIDE
jgi:hypothetical protein